MARLTDTIDVSTPDIYYDPTFKLLIEQHLEELINYKGNVYITVSPMDMEGWGGNLYGYLQSQGIPIMQHWIIMRMNGMDSTLAFVGDIDTLVLPDMESIKRLKELHNTVHTI